MKKSLFLFAFLFTAFLPNVKAQTQTQSSFIPQLLASYFTIKDALVADNAADAATNAQAFVKIANGVDYKIISESNINAIIKDADKISASKDIKVQRAYFKNLSSNMSTVAKTFKTSASPIYQAYCPMVKSYWLSKEKEIKNPYYGSSMLMCGEVKETIE